MMRVYSGPVAPGSAWEVLRTFLRLGVSCFGGPVAHLGYFHTEFVERRRWLDEKAFADLAALCQFLPGPASSQMGFSIGLMRAGARGALAAWLGFTLPSALAMALFAQGAGGLHNDVGRAALHGLRLVAVAIVAQAVWSMARSLCPDRQRAGIALATALLILGAHWPLVQLLVIAFGAAAGLVLCRAAGAPTPGSPRLPVPTSIGAVCLTLYCALLLLPPLLATAMHSDAIEVFDAFYRSGALVFGGGHVVLPLLREAFVGPGWVDEDAFLAGYGAAQAVPGPLFTFAAYLGMVLRPSPHGWPGALLGLIGIFLPGMLVLVGTLPFWSVLRGRAGAQAAMRGVNAAVVGVLGAALYSPLWTGSVHNMSDLALVLVGFVLLNRWRAPPLLIVLLLAAGAILLR